MQTPINDRTEERLLAEIEELKRQLHAQHRDAGHRHAGPGKSGRPSATTLWILGIVASLILVGAFFAGYLPETSRQTALAKDAKEDSTTLPPVNVIAVEQASAKSQLVLPGNIQAVTEAPVLARASGYVKTRYVDIGDRVKEGQLLADIEAPELDQQVRQAKASVEQAKASLDEANANLQQGKTNRDLARVTYERWNALVQKGAVSRQDADTYKSQSEALGQNVQSLEKAVSVAQSNIAAVEANQGRLTDMQGYLKVRAPFAGVITLRNVDTGALVAEGNTLLFRIAQTDRLRTYVNVPQADSTSIRVGQTAQLKIPDLPLKTFIGTVTRTASALDPATRTLLAEVQVPNADGLLLPGMYSQVNFTTPRMEPPLMIRADALVVRADGPKVAVVSDSGVVHFQPVQVGRDYGDQLEILGGLEKGQKVVISPGDVVRENAKVHPILIKEKADAQ
ncbi:MAG TPA: efflux RND transporter periplasmic adaptor subunit [Bryobacteraceae bacterium]|jgi:RND family efflux transporter MFP subunit|nr:efflux RND transporter periplasmic adaptor subunit [Bryobacteraceae bacterium]